MSTTQETALTTRRDGLGTEIERRHETASAAVAARAQAAIQARYVMAIQRPRSIDSVRLDLLAECRRPRFAEVARWKRPQGKDKETGEALHIHGWSIRFIEAAIRCMRNVSPEVSTLYDDESKRILRCAVVDFEANVDWSQEITIEKTVERRWLKKGQVPISQRLNSYGDLVYLVPATEEEVRAKEGASVSKTLRVLGQRLIPGDLLDEALEVLEATVASEEKKDPEAARKRLIDGFAAMGVRPEQIVEYFGGKSIGGLEDADRMELRGIYAAMKDGTRWADVLSVSPHRGELEGEGEPDSRLQDVAARVRGNVEKLRKKGKRAKAEEAADQAEAEAPPQPKITDVAEALKAEAGEREPGEGE